MKNTQKTHASFTKVATNDCSKAIQNAYGWVSRQALPAQKPVVAAGSVMPLMRRSFEGALKGLEKLADRKIPCFQHYLGQNGWVLKVEQKGGFQFAHVAAPYYAGANQAYKGMLRAKLRWPASLMIEAGTFVGMDVKALANSKSVEGYFVLPTIRAAKHVSYLNPFDYAEAVLPEEGLIQPGSALRVSSSGLCGFMSEVFRTLQPCDRELFNEIVLKDSRFDHFLLYSASTRFHHKEDHGLLLHTAEVASNVLCLVPKYCNSEAAGASTDKLDLSLALLAALLHDLGKVRDYHRLAPNVYTTNLNCELVGHEQTMMKWIATACAHSNWYPEERQLRLEHAICAVKKQHDQSGVRKRKTLESHLVHEADCMSARNYGIGELSCLLANRHVQGV